MLRFILTRKQVVQNRSSWWQLNFWMWLLGFFTRPILWWIFLRFWYQVRFLQGWKHRTRHILPLKPLLSLNLANLPAVRWRVPALPGEVLDALELLLKRLLDFLQICLERWQIAFFGVGFGIRFPWGGFLPFFGVKFGGLVLGIVY